MPNMFNFVQAQRATTQDVGVFRVPPKLLHEFQLFERQPSLKAQREYTIESDVDPEVVDLFFARVMGDKAQVVTAKNWKQLRALSDELGFSGFDEEIRAANTTARIIEVCEQIDDHDMILSEILALLRPLQARVDAVEKKVELARQEYVNLRKEREREKN